MIFFFVPELQSSTDGVLHSQVYDQAKYLKRSGKKVLILSTDYRERISKGQEIINEKGIEGIILPYYPRRVNLFTLLVAVLISGLWLLRNRRILNDVTHIYTRYIYSGAIIFFIGKAIRGKKWVHDFRGLSSDEMLLNKKKNIFVVLVYKVFLYFERFCACKAETLSCVSVPMADHIKKISNRTGILIIPSSVDSDVFYPDLLQRGKFRDQWGVGSNGWVFGYCGSLFGWQKADQTLELLIRIIDEVPGSHSVIITTHTSMLQKKLENYHYDLERLHIYSTHNTQELVGLLSACDMGIIIRDDIRLNNVASPIKVSEYLACGLAVAISSNVGNVSKIIEEENLGCILPADLDKSVSAMADFCNHVPNRDLLRSNSRNVCLSEFSWQASVEKLLNIY